MTKPLDSGAWVEIDHSLVSLKLTELAEEMHDHIRAEEARIQFENQHNLNDSAVPSLVLQMKEQCADEWARRAYEIYCDVWRTQGRTKSASFVRAVYAHGILPMLRARAGAIAGEFAMYVWRTSFLTTTCQATLEGLQLRMQRLQDRWYRQLEAEAKECEHAERTKNLSTIAVNGTRPAPLSSDQATNLRGTPNTHPPADRKASSVSLNYRSELKRVVALQLTKDPDASDLSICRGLDADGGVELPKSLTGGGRDRLFVTAYSDRRRRHRLELTFSKVRKDMRKKGLLKNRPSK